MGSAVRERLRKETAAVMNYETALSFILRGKDETSPATSSARNNLRLLGTEARTTSNELKAAAQSTGLASTAMNFLGGAAVGVAIQALGQAQLVARANQAAEARLRVLVENTGASYIDRSRVIEDAIKQGTRLAYS